ncbi:hypothetical protein BG011_008847, partial [Mortierella polycephala]
SSRMTTRRSCYRSKMSCMQSTRKLLQKNKRKKQRGNFNRMPQHQHRPQHRQVPPSQTLITRTPHCLRLPVSTASPPTHPPRKLY